jgi:hypothetical protein
VDHDLLQMLSEREVSFLLEELCVTYGCCVPPAAYDRLLATPPSDAESFALAVFRAEGVEPAPSNRRLYRQVLAHVERTYERARPPAT